MNLIFLHLVLFLMVCKGQDNLDAFVIQSSKAIVVPRGEKGHFSYPQHHPLSNREKDYSCIHPHDTLHLYLKMENGSSYFTVLKPNIDLISPDIHNEVANNKLSSNHPHTILSSMKVYQGHMGQEVLDSHGSFFLDSASLVIQDDGTYVPTQTSSSTGISSTQHQFLNPKIKGSIKINGEVFEISSPLENRGTLLKKRELSRPSSKLNECGVIPQRQGQFFPKSSLMKRTVGPCPSTVKVASIAVAADCHYLNRFKGIKGAMEHLTTIYNEVSAVYQQHFNVKIRIAKTYLEEKCGGNPWNVQSCGGYSIQSMLQQFTPWIQQKRNPGIAYSTLFTGCKNSDATVGYAYVDELCTPRGVGVTGNAATEVNVALHEMGHVFGSNHDCNGSEANCCACQGAECNKSYVMNPQSTNAKEFSKCTVEKVCHTIATKGSCLKDSNGNDNNNMENQGSGGTTEPEVSGDNSGGNPSGNGIPPSSGGQGLGPNTGGGNIPGGSTCAGNQPATSVPNIADRPNAGGGGIPGYAGNQNPTTSVPNNAIPPTTSSPGSCPYSGNSFEKTSTTAPSGHSPLNPISPGSRENGAKNGATLSNPATHGNDVPLSPPAKIGGSSTPGTSAGHGFGLNDGGGGSISAGNQHSTSSVPNNAPTSPSPGSSPNSGNNFEKTSPTAPLGHSPLNPVSPGSSENRAKIENSGHAPTGSGFSSNPASLGNDAPSSPSSKIGGSGTVGTSAGHGVGFNEGGGSTFAGNQHSSLSFPNNAPKSPSPGSSPNAGNNFEKTSPTAPLGHSPLNPVSPGSSENRAKNGDSGYVATASGSSRNPANSQGKEIPPNNGGGGSVSLLGHSSLNTETDKIGHLGIGHTSINSISDSGHLHPSQNKLMLNPKEIPKIRDTGIIQKEAIGEEKNGVPNSITQGKNQNIGSNNRYNLNPSAPGQQSKTTEVNSPFANKNQGVNHLFATGSNLLPKSSENVFKEGSSILQNLKPSGPGQPVNNSPGAANKLSLAPGHLPSTIVPAMDTSTSLKTSSNSVPITQFGFSSNLLPKSDINTAVPYPPMSQNAIGAVAGNLPISSVVSNAPSSSIPRYTNSIMTGPPNQSIPAAANPKIVNTSVGSLPPSTLNPVNAINNIAAPPNQFIPAAANLKIGNSIFPVGSKAPLTSIPGNINSNIARPPISTAGISKIPLASAGRPKN